MMNRRFLFVEFTVIEFTDTIVSKIVSVCVILESFSTTFTRRNILLITILSKNSMNTDQQEYPTQCKTKYQEFVFEILSSMSIIPAHLFHSELAKTLYTIDILLIQTSMN